MTPIFYPEPPRTLVLHPWDRLPKLACPCCQRKGLHYANHPHAQGFKDYTRAVCRFCRKRFTVQFEDHGLFPHENTV